MKQEMVLVDDNNNEVKCNVVARWNNNGNYYIAYTDGSIKDDKEELFVSKVIMDNDKIILVEITDDEEWDYVNNYLEDNFYNGEDYE